MSESNLQREHLVVFPVLFEACASTERTEIQIEHEISFFFFFDFAFERWLSAHLLLGEFYK
jgi:hypothetical protein